MKAIGSDCGVLSMGPLGAPTKMKPAEIVQAKQWRKEGIAWIVVGRRLGVSPDTVRRAIEPGFADRRKKVTATHRAAKEASSYVPLQRISRGPHSEFRPTQEEYLARIREIPQDTRDLTGTLMGDPLPGRRALDKVLVQWR